MIISLSVIFLLIAAVALLTRVNPQSEGTVACYGSDASFLDSFSLNRYQPMLRLASQFDKEYLAEAHGSQLADCYRKIQRSLLREYLRDLSNDFKRLHAIATSKAVLGKSDVGDLSLNLLEQQMSFAMSIWGIEARLLFDDYLPFTVDLTPLILHLDALASQTRTLLRPQYSYSAL